MGIKMSGNGLMPMLLFIKKTQLAIPFVGRFYTLWSF